MQPKPLELSRQILIWLCMCPPDMQTSSWQKVVYALFTLTVFSATVSTLVASVIFFLEFVLVDLAESLHGFANGIASIGLCHLMIVAFILRYKISFIFEQLSTVYSSGKYYNWEVWKKSDFGFHILRLCPNNNNLIDFRNAYHLGSVVHLPFMIEANNKSKWLCILYYKFMWAAFLSTMSIVIVSVIYCYIVNGTYEINHFYHPFKLRLVKMKIIPF